MSREPFSGRGFSREDFSDEERAELREMMHHYAKHAADYQEAERLLDDMAALIPLAATVRHWKLIVALTVMGLALGGQRVLEAMGVQW